MIAFAFFALKDPDRLQSEDYQIQKTYQLMLEDGRSPKTIDVTASPPEAQMPNSYVQPAAVIEDKNDGK
ncbi:hypothetical protein PMI09_02172 [Rhizobium sp. CF122]|uniref:hypothetical protein n=1 Tax=Rhizobium sp. CF122 TaxID=1144312 RepID=UPI000271D323|nr:hypothetical protein [Rhizobium sp. CF122]EJL54856.1 hypothetical protein PMI09_02172 [Rhizobium sp. CF122]